MDQRHPNPATLHNSDTPIFAAVITPHRSLGQQGFRLVMTLVCLASIIASIPFMIAGAWPVAGFFGLDVLALYVAFRVNFRDARGFEEVAVSPVKVMLAKVTPKGERAEWRFDTIFTRLERQDDEDFGLMRLSVVSRGQSVQVAQALSPRERASLYDAMAGALAKAKGA
ncbi:MAG: DUF2244 domain-containing protein [Hyphomicrobiales bacterium]|jgi:uncharacterized membrane protein|nr:DUF2244 domain-containing protein [Hyphomicrobiales bacterium]